MTIKQGTMVKAWDDDPSDYVIGFYQDYSKFKYGHWVRLENNRFNSFRNAIEIPPELAKALEELGNE